MASDKDKARLLAGAAEAKTKAPSMGPAQPITNPFGSLFGNLAKGIEWAEEKTEPLVAPLREHVINPYLAYPLAKFTREHRLAGAPPGEPTREEVEKGSKMLFSPLDVVLPGVAKVAGVAGLAGLTLHTVKSKKDLFTRVDEFSKLAAEASQRGDVVGFEQAWEAVHKLGEVAKRRNFQGAQPYIDAALARLNGLHNLRVQADLALGQDELARFQAKPTATAAPSAPEALAGAAEAKVVAAEPTVDEAEAMARALGEKPKRKPKTQEELDELALKLMRDEPAPYRAAAAELDTVHKSLKAGLVERISNFFHEVGGIAPGTRASLITLRERASGKFPLHALDEEGNLRENPFSSRDLARIVIGDKPLKLPTLAKLAARFAVIKVAVPYSNLQASGEAMSRASHLANERHTYLHPITGQLDIPESQLLGELHGVLSPNSPLGEDQIREVAANLYLEHGPRGMRPSTSQGMDYWDALGEVMDDFRTKPLSEIRQLIAESVDVKTLHSLVVREWKGLLDFDGFGHYSMPADGIIRLKPGMSLDEVRSVLSHEVGHILMGVRSADATWNVWLTQLKGADPAAYKRTMEAVLPELHALAHIRRRGQIKETAQEMDEITKKFRDIADNMDEEVRVDLPNLLADRWTDEEHFAEMLRYSGFTDVKSAELMDDLRYYRSAQDWYNYATHPRELLADALSMFMLDPKKAKELAPTLHRTLRDFVFAGQDQVFKNRGVDFRAVWPIVVAGLSGMAGKSLFKQEPKED